MGGCRKCCGSIITLGISITASYIFFIATTKKNPTFFLLDLQIPPNSSIPSISYEIQIVNRNQLAGIYYDNLFVFGSTDGDVRSNVSVIPAFYQGHHKKARKSGTLEGGRITRNSSSIGVGVEGRFKHKGLLWWRSKKKEINVVAKDVKVNVGANFTPVQLLTSSVGKVRCGQRLVVGIGVVLICIL